jgi:hypothetical protein
MNRRPLNNDGSIPKCLQCGNEARKHLGRNKWYETCSRVCAEERRIAGMTATKRSANWSKVGKEAANKAVATMRKEHIDGQSVMQRKSSKIKATNNTLGIDGLTGYQRASRKASTKVRSSNEVAGNWTPIDQLTEREIYARKVDAETRLYDLTSLENYKLRGKGSYHLDHRFSVQAGFTLGISPEIIGHICNLEMKPEAQNISKNCKCDITLDELTNKITLYESMP